MGECEEYRTGEDDEIERGRRFRLSNTSKLLWISLPERGGGEVGTGLVVLGRLVLIRLPAPSVSPAFKLSKGATGGKAKKEENAEGPRKQNRVGIETLSHLCLHGASPDQGLPQTGAQEGCHLLAAHGHVALHPGKAPTAVVVAVAVQRATVPRLQV